MYFACFLFAMVTPVCLFAVGLLWRLSPPKFQGKGLAYRTALSTRSEETWRYAHQTCAKIWLRMGLALGVVTVLLLRLFQTSYLDFLLWLIAGQMAFFCVSAFLVDTLLKNLFDEDGKRISES
jgi:hypothetical protein